MSKKKISPNSRSNSLMAYTLPKLHTGKSWYVDFYCYDPLTQDLRRKKYMLDRIKTVKQRRARASELITTITYKLQHGWNCWAETDNTRHYTTLTSAMDLYKRTIDKQYRTGALREKTWRTYMSYFKGFSSWLDECPVALIYVYQVDRTSVLDFLDYLYHDKDVSARTRNNYKSWLYTFCEWLMQKNYITINPVDGIKNLREEAKKRNALTKQELSQLRRYLLDTGQKHYLLACLLEYYAMIRPNELCFLRIGDFKVTELKIVVSGTWSKNRRDEAVGLNSEVLKLMVDLGIFNFPSDFYVFGKNFVPSQKQAQSRIFREKFTKIREALGWSDSLQFYSLKDSGIRDLANSEGIVIARDQARHADVSTTNRYLKGEAMPVHEETKTFRGSL